MTMADLFMALTVKHFLADFPMQPPWIYLNKGKYGHPGGVVHAGVHLGLTLPILCAFGVAFWPAFALAALEALAHYHIDWLKVWGGKKAGIELKPDLTRARWFFIGPRVAIGDLFFWALGADQLAHFVCYYLIVKAAA